MSKHFVPVVDVETPRSERDNDNPALLKHRKFDNPFAIHKYA